MAKTNHKKKMKKMGSSRMRRASCKTMPASNTLPRISPR